VVVALISMPIVAYLTAYTMQMMIKIAKIVNVNNYENLCEFCFGNFGFYLISGSMFLFDFGAMLIYLIIIGDAAEFLVDF